MWQGHRHSLGRYGLALALEIIARPEFKVSVGTRWFNYYSRIVDNEIDTGDPSWLGCQAFHDAHKSNLLRKDPDWYGQFGWDVPTNLPYIWPKP